MTDYLFGLLCGYSLAMITTSYSRRRGGKPAPPAGPPEQPLQAQLIRYWAWEEEQVRRARAGEPIRMDEGTAQRGNGHGGPTTAKPPIKPQPSGGRLIRGDRLP